MNWLDFLYYALTALAGLSTTIPFIIKLFKARTVAEKAQAANAIITETKRLVAEAEATYREIDAMMKRTNSSAGGLKKAYVVNALKAFCLENGYAWNAAEMDEAIESEVAYTKTVNAKNA